jgi:hypothetical protein
MHEAAITSGEPYRVIYQSDAPPKFKSDGTIRPKRPRRSPEWYERQQFAWEMGREERQAARDRHRATIPGREHNVDLRPGRLGDDTE